MPQQFSGSTKTVSFEARLRLMKKRRVVITGMGAVTPLGLSVPETWEALKAGKSGIGPITVFEAEGFPAGIAGEVRGFSPEVFSAGDPELLEASRGTLFAVQAVREAMGQAGLAGDADLERLGLCFGTGDSGNFFPGFCSAIKHAADRADGKMNFTGYLEGASKFLTATSELELQPYRTLAHLARVFSAGGPVSNPMTACAASSQAMGEAFEMIRRGDADAVISGGSHAMVYPLAVTGFSQLTALSRRNHEPERASRPFDKNRDGFVIAEGAGAVILESEEHARARGAAILGELCGYGSTADAYRMTDMDPEGKGACRAVEAAMRKAELSARDIDYINAHGTSTQVNDAIETLVIKKVLRENAPGVPVSSIKSMLGHMIAAAGAVELITCLLTLREGVIPPTINYQEPDPACDLDYVPNQARFQKVRAALSNSFGFGGQNICLAVRRYE